MLMRAPCGRQRKLDVWEPAHRLTPQCNVSLSDSNGSFTVNLHETPSIGNRGTASFPFLPHDFRISRRDEVEDSRFTDGTSRAMTSPSAHSWMQGAARTVKLACPPRPRFRYSMKRTPCLRIRARRLDSTASRTSRSEGETCLPSAE